MKLFTNSLTRIAAISFLVAFTSCTKDNEPADVVYDIRGNTPAVSSGVNINAYANFTGGYSATYKKVAFNINWYNIAGKVTGTSLAVDSEGSLEVIKNFGVTEGAGSGLTASDMMLTKEQETKLLNGEWVFTVNTVDHPAGELVGKMQVIRTQ